MHNPRGLP
ncbi:unnamed protein product, partial [Didymodactylos carnosus]